MTVYQTNEGFFNLKEDQNLMIMGRKQNCNSYSGQASQIRLSKIRVLTNTQEIDYKSAKIASSVEFYFSYCLDSKR